LLVEITKDMAGEATSVWVAAGGVALFWGVKASAGMRAGSLTLSV